MNHELTAWLGDSADQLTDGQRDRLARVAERIATRYPDDSAARENALTAAAQLAFGDAALSDLGGAYVARRAEMEAAHEALTGAMLWADEDGLPQTQIAAQTGVTRMTVRKALGL